MGATYAKAAQTARNRQNAVDEIMERILLWWLQESPPGTVPELCVDRKAYKGKVLRWYEPILPGRDNPVLIEEAEGDNWTLRIDRIVPKITNLKPT